MSNQQKNYIGFLNDNSGSMASLSSAALKDYNNNVNAVKDAATKNAQDTIVSSFGFGGGRIERTVVNSNPHVLAPLASWRASGGTPGRRAIKEMIDMFKALPDYSNPNVAFVVFTTTDGQFDGDAYGDISTRELAAEIATLSRTERWTFVFRVPRGGKQYLSGLNIPDGNIQEWDTTAAGMAASTQATTQAFDQFYATRATGKTSSTVFYADASKVSAAAVAATLKDISKEVSLYVVPAYENGIEIRPFILNHRAEYLKGSGFYQLTKTEPRVQENKLIAIRNRATGAIYSGIEARKLIGLPEKGNARLHPGDHGNFDIFIQSSSTNRKLVAGTGVLYWKAIGVPFGPNDEAYLQPKPVAPAAPAVVVLPAVTPTNRPTPSPIPAKKVVPVAPVATQPLPVKHAGFNGRVRYHLPAGQVVYFSTRDDARSAAATSGKKAYDAGPTAATGKRHFVV